MAKYGQEQVQNEFKAQLKLEQDAKESQTN
jgi:hypothetical protein